MTPEIAKEKLLQEMINVGLLPNDEFLKERTTVMAMYLDMAMAVSYDNGLRISSRCRPVIQYDKNGKHIDNFVSASDAARKTRICNRNISACCNGKLKTAGKFIWKYDNLN